MYLFNGGLVALVVEPVQLISWSHGFIVWQQVHLLNTLWRQLLYWSSLSLSSLSLWSRNYTHLIWRTSKMNNSIKLKRRLTQTLTYLYMIEMLSIVIIYPLLITIMSTFKTEMASCFKLDANVDFNANFQGLFTETLYGTWTSTLWLSLWLQ